MRIGDRKPVGVGGFRLVRDLLGSRFGVFVIGSIWMAGWKLFRRYIG
jgi:hypothetical protein